MKTVDSKVEGSYLKKAAYYELEAENIDFPFPKLFVRLADGADKIILSPKKYNDEHCQKEEKTIIKGFGHRVSPKAFDKKMEESENNSYILPWTRQANEEAYKRAKLTVNDIDFFEIHECFTSSECVAISCFGLTAASKGYEINKNGMMLNIGCLATTNNCYIVGKDAL